MLQRLSYVRVIDNTGVVRAKVIQVFSGRRVYSGLGDLVRIATQTIKRLKRVKKVKSGRERKIVFRKKRRMSTIVRVRRPINYIDGSTVTFKDNAVILYKKRKTLKGKRFYGVTTRMLGYEKFIKKFKMHI